MSEEAFCGYKLLVWPIMARCDLRRLYRRRIGVGNNRCHKQTDFFRPGRCVRSVSGSVKGCGYRLFHRDEKGEFLRPISLVEQGVIPRQVRRPPVRGVAEDPTH